MTLCKFTSLVKSAHRGGILARYQLAARTEPDSGCVFWQQQRWTTNASLDLKYPQTPHRPKARLLKATEPIYIRKQIPTSVTCDKNIPMIRAADMPPHPLEEILASKAKEVMAASRMIVLCHRNNMGMETKKRYKNAVWKLDVRMWPQFNNRIMRMAVNDSVYDVLNLFLFEETLLVTSKEADFTKMARAFKRMQAEQRIIPMLVIVDHSRVISPTMVDAFGKKYKDGIIAAHSELASALSVASSSLLRSLQHHTFALTGALDHLSKSVDSSPEKINSPTENVAS